MIDSSKGLVAVIEMSSHQLEFVKTSPEVAIITNIYPNILTIITGLMAM